MPPDGLLTACSGVSLPVVCHARTAHLQHARGLKGDVREVFFKLAVCVLDACLFGEKADARIHGTNIDHRWEWSKCVLQYLLLLDDILTDVPSSGHVGGAGVVDRFVRLVFGRVLELDHLEAFLLIVEHLGVDE